MKKSLLKLRCLVFLFPLCLSACSGSSGSSTSINSDTTNQSQKNTSMAQETEMRHSATTADSSEQGENDQAKRLSPYQDLPTSSKQLAAALIEAELAIVDEEAEQGEIQTYWGPRQQVLYRQLWANLEWEDTVAAEFKAKNNSHLLLAFNNNWAARKESSALVDSVGASKTLPAWTVTAPEDPEVLLAYYKEAEAATDIEWEYLAAVNLIETVVGRIDGVSTAGAVGPMQFLPTTWADCCEGDPTNTKDAIMGAAKYLVDRGGSDNMDKALFGYNNSQYYVNSVSGYAEVMKSNEQAFYGYHGWQVFFQSASGLVHLREGYAQDAEVAVATWIAENPASIVDEIQMIEPREIATISLGYSFRKCAIHVCIDCL